MAASVTPELLAKVARCVQDASGHANLADDDDLIDTGILDSVSLINLVVVLEGSLGVQIREDLLTETNFESPRAIATLCAKLLPEGHGVDADEDRFQEELAREVSRARRTELPVTIVLLQCEGAGAGGVPAALERVTSSLLRREDRVYCSMSLLGVPLSCGVLLPGAPRLAAETIAARLATVMKEELALAALPRFGVASFPPDAEEPDRLIRAALKALEVTPAE